ncbi:MAG: YHYH protein [Verrucomicrobia bacterium]|nr:YHYH protein [Verrucomicrobiota bacterium]
MKKILLALILGLGMEPLPAAERTVLTDTNRVLLTLRGDQRVIEANGIPDHAPGQFPNRGNPNRIAPQNYSFRVPAKPQAAAQPTDANRGWFGVALNGVPFEAGTAEFWSRDWKYEAIGGSINLGLDEHRAHVQPTGAYHYHGLPNGLIASLGGDGKKMLQIGWAADGFPIYTSHAPTDANDLKSALKKMRSSYQLKKGARPGAPNGPGGKFDGAFTADYEFVKGSGDLDECNGRFGVTPEFPQGTYYYCLTVEFPFAPRYWRGTPDASFMKRGPGPGDPGGPGGKGKDGKKKGPPGQKKGPPGK